MIFGNNQWRICIYFTLQSRSRKLMTWCESVTFRQYVTYKFGIIVWISSPIIDRPSYLRNITSRTAHCKYVRNSLARPPADCNLMHPNMGKQNVRWPVSAKQAFEIRDLSWGGADTAVNHRTIDYVPGRDGLWFAQSKQLHQQAVPARH